MEGKKRDSSIRSKQASPGGVQNRAVTRSITRGKAQASERESLKEANEEKKSARARLLDRLKSKKPTEHQQNSASKSCLDTDCEKDGLADFCPLKFHGCFSSDVVQDIISSFDAKKLEILGKVGLSGLQHLKRGLHNSRHLVFWLLKRLDVQRMQAKLADGSRVDMTLNSVERILGIRCTGRNINCNSTKVVEYVKQRLRERFGTCESKEFPDLADLRNVLCRHYVSGMSEYEEETFMIALAGLCCAYMFGPPSRTAAVPRDIWEFIGNPKNLLQCNWGGYVLSVLQACARTVQMNIRSNPTSIKLGGCWLYLEVCS